MQHQGKFKRAAAKANGLQQFDESCQHLNVPLHYYNQSSVFSTQVVNVCGQLSGSSDAETAGIKPRGPEGVRRASTAGMKRS